MNATYSASAYRSGVSNALPPPRWKEDSNRNGIFDTHLAFGNYANLDPEMEIVGQLSIGAEDKSEVGGAKAYCNSMRWQFQNSSRVPFILSSLRMLSFPFVWIFWVGFIFGDLIPDSAEKYISDMSVLLYTVLGSGLVALSLFFYSRSERTLYGFQAFGFFMSCLIVYWRTGSLWGSESIQVALWIGSFLFFMGAIGFDAILWLYSKGFKHDGSEFNRLDGMLRFKRRFRRLFVAPFDEFDPVLQLLPSGYGSHDYALWLHHRYTDNKVCLATRVHSLGLDKANA
ncbi:hypothetical protein LZK35_31815, partial [Pseudomonas aeruginosa]|nr:hypothetical protein [Pseudomonas aeruginosa]